jgi:hypothetical protein
LPAAKDWLVLIIRSAPEAAGRMVIDTKTRKQRETKKSLRFIAGILPKKVIISGG